MMGAETRELAETTFPDCPFCGSAYQTFDKGRMMDHITDDHELWEKIFTGEVELA